MRVTIRGVVYPTVRAAADAFGVSTSYVYKAIAEGRQDSIGIGMGNWRKPLNRFYGNRINLHGFCFDSMTAASFELGFNRHYIRSALLNPSARSERRIKEAISLKKCVA